MKELATVHKHSNQKAFKKLLGLKIRYGELLEGEGVTTGRTVFGTVEETVTSKKG